MSQLSVSIVAEDRVIDGVCELAREEGIRCSAPLTISRDQSSLKAPIGPGEIEGLLTTVSLIFSTGTTALVFLDKLRDIARKFNGAHLEVKNAVSGRNIMQIDKNTKGSDIEAALGKGE